MTLPFLYISIVCLVGYLVFRFGMITRHPSASVVEFIGGSITFLSFVAVVYFISWKSLVGLVLVFWVVITPIVELVIRYLLQTHHASEKAQYGARRRKRELVHKEKANSSASPFLILSKIDNEGLYHVFLANPSDHPYTKVKKLTGAFASAGNGEDLLETSKAVFDLPDLPPRSCVEIDDVDWRERDFIVWYQLDLLAEDDTWKYLKGSLGKSYSYSDKDIEVFDEYDGKEGWKLTLSERDTNQSIDETIKTMHMESRYITYDPPIKTT